MPDSPILDSVEALRALYPEPAANSPVIKKQRATLNQHCREFIAHSPFLVLGTVGDVSPKGDHPGFVRVLDDATLLIPDRAGNNRIDSFRNIVANPTAAAIFFVPGVNETLRVNGRCEITSDAAVLAPSTFNGKAPKAGFLLHVEEVFLQCAKALVRSRLWQPDAWPDRAAMTPPKRMLAEQTGSNDDGARYETNVKNAMTDEGRS
jgi:PPOX class probable FMN-dependent enzyme